MLPRGRTSQIRQTLWRRPRCRANAERSSGLSENVSRLDGKADRQDRVQTTTRKRAAKAEVVRIILWSLVRAQHGLPHFPVVPPRFPGRMHPWHYRATAYPPIGGLFICCPRWCRIFVHLPVLSRLFAVPSCPVSTSPCVVRLRAGRFPWNP